MDKMSETRLDPATLRALIEEADRKGRAAHELAYFKESDVWAARINWLQAKLDALPEDGEVRVDFGDSGMDRIETLIDLAGKKVLEARAQHDDRNVRKWVAFVEWLQEQAAR